MTSTDYLVWGCVFHFIADWFFQNDHIAKHKSDFRDPMCWLHGFTHLVAMSFLFPLWTALWIALVHMLIDTRVPLEWWRKTFKQTVEGPYALPVAMAEDQIAHIATIAVAALFVGGRP